MPCNEMHEGLYRDSWLMVFGSPSPFRVETLDAPPIEAIEPLAQEAATQGFEFMRRLNLTTTYPAETASINPGRRCLACTANESNALVGFGGLNIDGYLHHPRVGRVRHVYVLAAHRRCGAGRDLLMALITAARKHALNKSEGFDICCGCAPTHAEGARFYESIGFQRHVLGL